MNMTHGLNREIDGFFDGFWGITLPAKSWHSLDATAWTPACDIEEADDHYLLTLDAPGVPKDKIRVEVVDDQVTISGERQHESRSKNRGTRYTERRQGKFQRHFTLPAGLDADKVEANYQDGLLRVYVPKAESAKPRQIKITNGAGSTLFGKLIGQSEKVAS